MDGWIGVDLDGTLAHYEGWNGGKIGEPVPLMLQRVRRWLDEGRDVRIVTARIATMFEEEEREVKIQIENWCHKHLGTTLPITCSKDQAMVELWDDRCVQVEKNTGRRIDGLA